MASTQQWSESNLVGQVETLDISNLNFGSHDSPNLSVAAYPIIRGESSFIKYLRVKFGGSYAQISNMKFWKSLGSLKTGETINAAANVAYATPTDSPTADSSIPTDVGSALSLQSAEGNSVIEPGSGVSGYTKYVRLQLQTTGSTPVGGVNQKTFTFQWDES
jgi:hypothetical protein